MATIIFDLDGTLADSFDYVADFLAAEAGKPRLTDAEKESLRRKSPSAMASRLGFRWWQKPGLFFKGRKRMREAIKHLKTFRGMPEVIKKLHDDDKNDLFILSANSLCNMHPFLIEQGIDKYFQKLYGKAGLFKAPVLRKLLKEQNLDAASAYYVGDEARDILAAKSAGIKAIAVSWGFADRQHLKSLHPHALVDTPQELLQALK